MQTRERFVSCLIKTLDVCLASMQNEIEFRIRPLKLNSRPFWMPLQKFPSSPPIPKESSRFLTVKTVFFLGTVSARALHSFSRRCPTHLAIWPCGVAMTRARIGVGLINPEASAAHLAIRTTVALAPGFPSAKITVIDSIERFFEDDSQTYDGLVIVVARLRNVSRLT